MRSMPHTVVAIKLTAARDELMEPLERIRELLD